MINEIYQKNYANFSFETLFQSIAKEIGDLGNYFHISGLEDSCFSEHDISSKMEKDLIENFQTTEQMKNIIDDLGKESLNQMQNFLFVSMIRLSLILKRYREVHLKSNQDIKAIDSAWIGLISVAYHIKNVKMESEIHDIENSKEMKNYSNISSKDFLSTIGSKGGVSRGLIFKGLKDWILKEAATMDINDKKTARLIFKKLPPHLQKVSDNAERYIRETLKELRKNKNGQV